MLSTRIESVAGYAVRRNTQPTAVSTRLGVVLLVAAGFDRVFAGCDRDDGFGDLADVVDELDPLAGS
jgi:hypothetical protein